MQNRTLPLIVITTFIFIGLVVVQSIFFKPKIPDVSQAQPNTENLTAEQADELGNKSAKSAQAETTDPQSDDASQQEPEKDQDAESLPPRTDYPREIVTLGSLDGSSTDRMLAFLDSRGAVVRRIELNSRTRNGRFRYRDFELQGAYIGALEPKSVDAGCQVRVVGPGTPADQAGIKPGDVITAVDGVPIIGAVDFEDAVAGKRAGEKVEISLLRSADSGAPQLVFEVDTVRRPMQVIRPTPLEQLRPEDLNRRAFQLTLKQQSQGPWEDLDSRMRTENWQTQVAADGKSVEFLYDIAEKDGRGPFQVVKRYWLPASKEPLDVLDRAFHLNMEIEIRNLSKEAQTVNFELAGPTGTPLEGWWYQQKLHGGTWAIGYAAGARDVITNLQSSPFNFISGPQTVADENATPQRLTPLIVKGDAEDARTFRFMSVDTMYFNVALIPTEETYKSYSAFAITASQMSDTKKMQQRTTDISYVIYSEPIVLEPYDAAAPESVYKVDFEIFAGPKEPQLLDQYGLQDVRTFGWFAMFSKPLCWLLHLFHTMTFGWSYGLAIIMLTVLVRSLMIPISRKAALNAQMMQYLQPEIKGIADKYKDDMEKRSQAQRELFAKYNYNPFGGCLLMFLQLPIFIGLYRGLSVDIALRDQPLIPGLAWCSNLAGPDKLFNWEGWMPSFLAAEYGWLGPYFNLLPILTIFLFLAQQKLFMPPATDDQSRMMQKMMTFMMIFMGFIFFKVPSGLCVYFITSSVWGIVERKLLPKPELDKSKLDAMDDKKSTSKSSTKKKIVEPVSLPLRNEQELEARRRRDRERKKKLKDRK